MNAVRHKGDDGSAGVLGRSQLGSSGLQLQYVSYLRRMTLYTINSRVLSTVTIMCDVMLETCHRGCVEEYCTWKVNRRICGAAVTGGCNITHTSTVQKY